MDQDLIIIFGAAAFASAVLFVGFMWELSRSRRPLKVRSAKPARPIAASRPASRVESAGPWAPASPASKRRGPITVVRDLIDASIAMYAIRRLFGRDTTPRSQRPSEPETYLDEGVVASRIGVARPTGPVIRRPTRILVSGSPVGLAPVPVTTSAAPGPDRRRLLRDSLVTAGAVAAVLLLAVAFWPRPLQGGVLDEIGTPAPSAAAVVDVTASPSDAPAPSSEPTVVPTPVDSPVESSFEEPILTPSPTPDPTATPAPTPRPTAAPTPRPTAAPTAAPTPEPTPKPTPEPTPTSTPVPPVATFTWSKLLLVVSFDGRSSLDESTYSWDFDDGTSASSSSPTHTYLVPGSYQVTLTVTGPGGSDAQTRTVSVP